MTIFKAVSNVDSLVFHDLIINFDSVISKLAYEQITVELEAEQMQIKWSVENARCALALSSDVVISPRVWTLFSLFGIDLLMKPENGRGGVDDSMLAAHSAGFTVNISRFLSTQVADDDTKTDTRTHHTPHVRGLGWEQSSFTSAASEMRKRLIQIFGFLLTSLGWVFVLCTLAMDYWRITQIGGQGGSFIIKVAWYWSNLWKDCFTDSTAVTNCRDFPVLWTVTRKSLA